MMTPEARQGLQRHITGLGAQALGPGDHAAWVAQQIQKNPRLYQTITPAERQVLVNQLHTTAAHAGGDYARNMFSNMISGQNSPVQQMNTRAGGNPQLFQSMVQAHAAQMYAFRGGGQISPQASMQMGTQYAYRGIPCNFKIVKRELSRAAKTPAGKKIISDALASAGVLIPPRMIPFVVDLSVGHAGLLAKMAGPGAQFAYNTFKQACNDPVVCAKILMAAQTAKMAGGAVK